ncbi:MAG: zinc-ribbon and DUF3426 domain-containing protein [Steroidobacteraceae bacterium]|nr:zinc-ribbon and DUF3426 domain-containing protein [Steroidobacteraceae bacterium]
MITICPQCQLPLAVTAADLRIAQGQVRCGRCAAVFNALASLYEPGSAAAERRAPAAPAAAVAPTGTSGAFRLPVPAEGTSGAVRAPAAAVVSRASPEGTSAPASASGLFRAPTRDDEPRFDDTHGADDWPVETPTQLATADAQRLAERDEAPSGGPPAGDPPPESRAETTDTFIREALAAEALDLDVGERAAADPGDLSATVTAQATSTAQATEPAAERDWSIDTMTAAELAALVARAERDEPPELASIRIAVDAASEITVLPSESPAQAFPGRRGEDAPAYGPRPDGTFPQLLQAADDDPDLAGARREAAERRAAMPRTASMLRWLELEPAPPAGVPLPPPTTDTGTDGAVDPAPPAAPAVPGALAASLGLDAELRPVGTGRAQDAATATHGDDAPGDGAGGADAVVAELAAGGATRSAPAPRWMWAATIALGLALAAQLVHLYREELVAQPALRAPLSRLYAALGRPLEPRWELARYELRQQGVVAEPVAAGTLTVRASIRNFAGRAQPAPLLRVTLQDRFGNRIATRDLTPREYGGAAAIAPAPMLAPGQRIDAEVSLLDPGGEAVGFELDVCLRRGDGAVACANDAPAMRG